MATSDRPAYRKRFGQHHLVRPELCAPLVEFLQPAGRRVFEIGPGGGVLTRALVTAGARVTAAEVDPAWAFTFARGDESDATQLLIADALEIAWERLPPDWLVAGNLPYNVATPLIRRVLESRPPGARVGFLVQHEVALRLTEEPGGKEYGAASVLVAARARALRLGRVRAASFRPPPRVDGQFVGFVVREPAVPEAEMPALTSLVHDAFARRRKTLRNALGATRGRAEAETALAAAEVDPGRRAESLSLEDFVRLHRAFTT